MDILWFLRKNKTEEKEEVVPSIYNFYDHSKKNMEELFKAYELEELLLKAEANRNYGKISKESYRGIEAIEKEIISRLPDKIQRDIFEIFVRPNYRFNIVQMLQDKNGWDEEIKTICKKDICCYLRNGLVSVMEPLPFTGHRLFMWLLSKAGSGNSSGEKLDNIFDTIKVIVEEKRIFNHDFEENEIQIIVSRLLVIFVGKYAKQTGALIDIWSEVEGGREYLEKVMTNKYENNVLC
ncbi:MAG: hypothetical protein KAJ10_02075 [Thermodesulfovibrionia bacterium]|nr:hypothetical protein [Thermodesulfovibrionia bacterium]